MNDSTQIDWLSGWPERPPAPANEQRNLPLSGTLQARYDAWRATDEGALFFKRVEGLVLIQFREPGVRRLSIDWVWQDLRRRFRQSVDNSFRALAVRELVDLYPALRPLFRLRKRTAA